ncbi:MAG: hypothetical protein KDA44_23855, partial [Planctomycetales bacterium]|nr:hypothetical protein [Planctomycetales bacterium]
FFVTVLIIRILSDRWSRHRAKFVPPIEAAAGPLMGLFTAVMFASFSAFTIYSIPIAAGEWKFEDGSGWAQTTFKSGSAPFYTVSKACLGSEPLQKLGL